MKKLDPLSIFLYGLFAVFVLWYAILGAELLFGIEPGKYSSPALLIGALLSAVAAYRVMADEIDRRK